MVRIAATPRAPISSVTSSTGHDREAITGRTRRPSSAERSRLARPGAAATRPAAASTGYGSTATASQDTGIPTSRTSSSAGAGGEHQRQPDAAARPAAPAAPSAPGAAAGGGSGAARSASAGASVRRRDGAHRSAARPARRGSAGWSPRRARRRVSAPADRHAPTVIRRPPPASNSPRVAASSSCSRSSRACRRLTGTSPTSVCASSPPDRSLRSSRTAGTASR